MCRTKHNGQYRVVREATYRSPECPAHPPTKGMEVRHRACLLFMCLNAWRRRLSWSHAWEVEGWQRRLWWNRRYFWNSGCPPAASSSHAMNARLVNSYCKKQEGTWTLTRQWLVSTQACGSDIDLAWRNGIWFKFRSRSAPSQLHTSRICVCIGTKM